MRTQTHSELAETHNKIHGAHRLSIGTAIPEGSEHSTNTLRLRRHESLDAHCERETLLRDCAAGARWITIAWMLAMGLWMANAVLVNLFDGWGLDRTQTQYLPILEGMGVTGGVAGTMALVMKGTVGVAEAAIAGIFLVGVVRPHRRVRLLGYGSAGLVLLFGAFLAVNFAYKGVGAIPHWRQYPELIAIVVIVYVALVGMSLVTATMSSRQDAPTASDEQA